MSSQLLDDVLAEPTTKKAFKAVSDLIPPDLEDESQRDKISQAIVDFVEAVVEVAARAKLPSTSRGVPVLWETAAEKCLEEAPILTLIATHHGELSRLGMPSHLPLGDLAVAVASDALRLRSRRRPQPRG